MELECDLSNINNEELLRKMWQQSEDSSRKKEIRSQLYKLRELRLKDLYQGDIMSDNTIAGFGKDPLTASHGDALADQSFQSLKSKEIRDSMSPTEMKFQSMALNHPSTTGWNVQSSKEVSPDGRGFRAETIATTDGVENVNGGTAEFKGRNEQFSSAHQQGDDKNFVKKAMESAKSHLQEKVVTGDENSGRTEVRTSSSTSTSSSQVFQSSSNVEYDDRGVPIAQHPQQHQPYLMDPQRHQQQEQQYHQEQQRLQEEQRLYEQQFRQQHQQQQERRTSEQLSTSRQNTEKKATSQNVQTQETHEQNKRYVDMDKASPEYQQHVQHLMQQPGEIISQNVEYPKPNVKMITTVKRLPDGTIVRNKRYETEEATPTTPTTRQTTTSTNQTNQRRDSQQQQTKNYQQDLTPSARGGPGATRRPREDVVDNVGTSRYVQDTHNDDVETTFSTVKKSSSKFNTESTSETIHESSNPETSHIKTVTTDFSTHGFPSVKSNKPTQEYPTDRPQGTRPSQGYPSQPMTSGPSDAVIPHFTDDVQNITERRIPTKDGELIIVSSEKKRNYKTSTNSERIIETEHNISDDQHYQQISDKTEDFTTHGFPSVRGPTTSQPKNYPEQRQMQPQGFPMDKIPPGTRIITTTNVPNEDVVVVNSQKSHTVKNSSNTERVIEHEVIRDDKGSYPRIQPNTEHTIYNYTVTTPGDQYPGGELPGSHRKLPTQDYSTQGFPSARSPNKTTPSTQGYPYTNRPNGNAESPRMSPTKTQPRATSPNKFRAPNSTRETTERVIRKEKEVDSAHRAFAASLRSSSPVESTRRDSYTTDGRHTPRSSVSSTKNFRRDIREGSHDSAPSETSRISTTTITRQTPPRTVGGKTTVTKVVTTKNAPGSNDSSPRATKSPSPGKTVTTTTTTKTITSKTPASPTKEVPKSTGNAISGAPSIRGTNQFPNPPIIIEKSPLKQSSPQPPAPNSRTSTPSYKSSKPLMADDQDDQPEKFYTTQPTTTTSSPLSPSRSSRTPKQPIGPNHTEIKPNPKDDFQPRKPVNNDECRTVNREPTFEKIEDTPRQEPKPTFEQPNIEWVVVDDVDIERDEDDDDYDHEDVDFGINIKTKTQKLITHEKDVPIAPNRRPKPTTSTIRTKQEIYKDMTKPQGRPVSKSPTKVGPQKPLRDARSPTQTRPLKLVPDSKTPQHLTSKIQPSKPTDNKPQPKSPKNTPKSPTKDAVPSFTPTQRKPQTKVTTDDHLVRKTLKTSEIVKERSTNVVDDKRFPVKETPKRRIQSPENKPKQNLPVSKNREETITIIESNQKRFPEKDMPKGRSPSPDNKPKHRSPVSRMPEQTEEEIVTITETTQKRFPKKEMPTGRSPSPDNKPKQRSPVSRWPEQTEEDTITVTETAYQRFPERETPKRRSESPENIPKQRRPGYRKETDDEEAITVIETTQKRFPEREIPKRRSQSPENRPKQQRPGYRTETNDEENILVIESTKKHVLTEKQTQELEDYITEPIYQDNKTPKYVDTSKPQKGPKFPNREVPTPQQRKPKQNVPVDDQTFRKTLRTTEILTTNMIEDEEFPEEDVPYKKGPRPETTPKDRKPANEKPVGTDEDESFTETTEFVIKSSQNRVVSEKEIQEFEESSYPSNKSPKYVDSLKPKKGPKAPNKDGPQSPEKDASPYPTPNERKPKQNVPEENQTFRKTLKTTDNLREITTTILDNEEFPEEDTPYKKDPKPQSRPKSPQKEVPQSLKKNVSPKPTPNERKPKQNVPVDDQTFRKTLRTNEIVKEKTTKILDKEPFDTDEDETFTETSEFVLKTSQKRVVLEKPIQELEGDSVTESNYPENNAPKYLDSTKSQKGPKTPNKNVSQTTKTDVSPTRTHKKPDQKLPENDQTFRKTLRTTEVLKEKTSKFLDTEKIPEEERPSKKGPRPESTPKDGKPGFEKPTTETDEDETYTNEFVIKSSQTRVAEQQIHELQDFVTEPKYQDYNAPKNVDSKKTQKGRESPNKEVSPTRPQRKPDQKLTEDHKTFRKTLRTTEVMREKTTKTLDTEKLPKVVTPKVGSNPESIPKVIKPCETDEDETFTQTSELTFNTTQKRVVSEKQVVESEEEPNFPDKFQKKGPKDLPKSPRKEGSPTPGSSPMTPHKNHPVGDQTFRKTLRTNDKKNKPKDQKPQETDDDEGTTDNEELLVEICETRIVTEKDIDTLEDDTLNKPQSSTNKSSPKDGPKTLNPTQKKPDDDKTYNKTFTTTYEETIETVKGQTYPQDTDKFPNTTKTPKSETFKTEAETLIQEALKPNKDKPKTTFSTDEKWLPKKTPVITSNINEQFIETERVRNETLDGAFISKTTEPSEPLSPTFKKKGAGRTDTFEERCRHILGMETYGDTPGTFKKQPLKDVEETKEEINKKTTTTNEDFKNTTIFQVKIEDCGDDDDEPMSINAVHKQINITERKRNEPLKEEPKSKTPENVKEKPKDVKKKTLEQPKKKPTEPMEKPKKTRTQPMESKEKPLEEHKKIPSQSSRPERNSSTKADYSDTDEFVETITETTVTTKTDRNLSPGPKRKPIETSPKKSPKTKPLDDTDDTSEQETYISTTHFEDTQEHIDVIKKQTKKSELKVTKKSIPSTSPRSVSPTQETSSPRSKSPTKETSSPRSKSPTKESSSPRSKSPTKESLTPRSESPTKESLTPRSVSPTKESFTPRSVSPFKESSSPRSLSPTKDPLKPTGTPKRKPSRESLEPKSTKTTPKKQTPRPDIETKTTTTIKDRLRSSTRKTKSPSKQDQVDGSDSSSPEPSPTRISERRRSSNISVITEILIDHTDMEAHGKKEKSPGPKRPQDSVFKDIIDSTVLPDKLPRKMLVTERKESAPVHRVTHKDKDSKMSRSTSENLIKVKKPDVNTLSPKSTTKSTEHRRPNKCFATKSINLTTTDRLVNSKDIENVIIDIQHAKSSREPSPDKIVPTPVPAHLDTGKPRYPDVVQEPEDEHPRKKSQVKNIPIFEEEHNSYVGCHITEVNMEKTTRRTTMDSLDYDQEILNNPLIEAPPSLDYPSLDKPNDDDECLLTVHEKVSKFQHIAEEVKKPKPSSRFTREFDETCKVPEEDECLLTVDEKVDKFLKTAENVTKPMTTLRDQKVPYFEDNNKEEDEEFVRNERIYSSIKLTPSEPQKSPDLVRNISRHISRQSDIETTTDQPLSTTEDSDYGEATTNEDFVEYLKNNQQKTSTEECVMTHRETLNKKYQQIPKKPNNDHHYDDEDDAEDDNEINEELIPHTATHTTIIEQRRQKDILTRPTVFDNKINKKPNATTTTTLKTPLKSTTTKSPVKDSEKLRPDNKSRTKPATATENTKTSTLNKRKTTTSSSPQRKHSDIEYEEVRDAGSGNNKNVVETGVGIISKQTKVYNNTIATTHTNSSNQRTNDLKKSTQMVNKKQPEKYIPVRLTPAKNLDESDLNTEEEEMIITVETTTKTKTPSNINDIPTVSGKVNKESYTTTPSYSPRKQPVHSSTNSSTAPLKTTKEHVIKLTERSTLKPNLDNNHRTNRVTEYPETFETPETVLEAPKRSPYTPKTKTTMETVAARRSLFENNNGSTTPTRRTPIASPLPGRRPSYMDHTKSSLEHTRRDSLEINKTNYSRKPSQTEDDQPQEDRNTLVKFNVPQSKLNQEIITTTTTSVTDDINIEEIFDLEVLERMLETVTSYEIRRRIRAQIRLIKKNEKNEMISSQITTTTKKTNSKPTTEEPDTTTRKYKPSQTRDRSLSPTTKSTKQFLIKESETQQSFKKQYKRQEVEVEEEENIQRSPLRPKSSPSQSPQRYHHEDSEYIRDRSPDTKRKFPRTSERSQSPQEKPVCARNAGHNRPRYHDEDDNDELIPHTARHTTQIEERRQKDILTRPSVFDNKKPLERSHSPQEDTPKCARNAAHNRAHSPEIKEVVREYGSKTTMKKQYFYKDEEHEEVDEINHETRRQSSASPTRKTSSTSRPSARKSPSPYTSPERETLPKRDSSPESKKPLKSTERSRSPPGKLPKTRVNGHSPDTKTSLSLNKSSSSYEQSLKSSTTKQPQPKRMPMLNSPSAKTSKPQEKSSTPVWADRKNVLKTPGSNNITPRKPITSTLDSRSGFTKTTKSSMTSQKMSTSKSSFVEDDSITSSYGIGPTDENGLPLFGIRALKKKKQPTMEPCETTEEVTGYVVEEKYYSDNKTKPKVERKELIYSTNPEELEKIKEQVKGSTTRKSLKDAELKETRQTALITKTNAKTTPALRSSPEDDFLDSTTKYVRRGSVKEMSEKFIHRESSSSITEKSSYPKAGLILRTNSRKNSRDNDTDAENYDSYKTTRVQHTNVLADSDDAEHEYEVEESGSRHSGRFINESESECESIKTQREFKKVSSSTSSSTRSFLNSQGEEKVITNVSDCLERMRNSDNVIEEGDTAEDQEARALLNKFLGASIIMTGVESSFSPASSNRQSKIITTTTTNNNRSEASKPAKHEVKTTRVTKTIKSGNSSTPVTHTTCDIEEIWDEEILKELLEQARTYEERRKIRSRLRELMADREEKNTSQAGDKEVKPTPTETTNVQEEEDSSASEYEEIIEEITDYSESEAEAAVDDTKSDIKKVDNLETTVTEVKKTTKVTKTEETEKKSSESLSSDEETVEEEVSQEKANEKVKTTVIKTETKIEKEVKVESKESDDKTDSSEKGESVTQGSTTSNQSATNSKKLKSVQSSSKTTTTGGIKPKPSSEKNSSMHAPYNKTSSSTTASKTSRNPIVTVQTAGSNRADSTLISNKSLHSSSKVSNSSSVVSNTVAVGNNSSRQVDRLGVPQKEDSGTESGEDLRLIAAGLRDQLQIQSDTNIIEDVTCALKRLESSLKEGKDITVDLEKRKALLALVARLQAGLTSPEKLAEIAAAMSELDGNEGLYGETSSPEADAHRSNRSRFGKRRSRINRHTVGVSREELADARRYMEDMMMMSNSISQSTTPEANNPNNISPPQWYPIEKNASTGAVTKPPSPSILQRPKQILAEETNPATNNNKLTVNNNKRRPLSGDYSVSFEPQVSFKQEESTKMTASSRELNQIVKQSSPTDDNSKFSRFSSNKKHLMKRANTIDIAKTQKYRSEFDTDSDAEDKGPHLGLKRTVQVSVKKRVGNVVPPFEPKTENDRKFLAFINKQSDKPGLGWTTSRSVSNWTNKFGSIKNTFEGGLVSKPPQVPHHSSHHSKHQQHSTKLFNQPVPNNSAAPFITTNQQIAQRLKQEAERQAEERRRKLEREHLEYERQERDTLERQRQQRERQERERLEREYFERQRREQDQIAAAQHAAILREQEQLAKAQQAANMHVPKPMPINEFKHAPQSVFRPIDNGENPVKPIYKPIPQLPLNSNNWQSMNSILPRGGVNNHLTPTSPNQYGNTRPDSSFITSPTPSSRSPIGLPWATKPTVDSSSFKTKAHRFEERSKYDNVNSSGPLLHRHNSLRSANGNNQQIDDFRKRPSLPNTCDPYSVNQLAQHPDPLAYLPPPQNISFTYSDLKPKVTYQSYPCLPTAVDNNDKDTGFYRSREDSLTDPHSVPLVLTSSNPSYCPPQQQQLSQPRLPRQFDIVSPLDSAPTSPSIMLQTDCTDDDIDSDNLLEYHAVSRVMGKPQSQTAVTVGRRTGHVSDDELYGKNSRAARNLLSTMKNIGNPNLERKQKPQIGKRSEQVSSPKQCLSPDGRSYQAPIVEPLFPDVTNFEANRTPLYGGQPKQQKTPSNYTPNYEPPRQNKYKSMENLNRSQTSGNHSNYMTPLVQPLQLHVAAPPAKPYVSETQASYVVTYPIEDTTDDEDFSRHSQRKMLPPTSLDLRRQRNISETSTGSSTTTSLSYSHNLPSPNTSWTANPIKSDDLSKYQNVAANYPTGQKRFQPQASVEGLSQSLAEQTYTYKGQQSPMTTQQSPTVVQQPSLQIAPSDYKRTVSYEAREKPTIPSQQQKQIPTPSYEAQPSMEMPTMVPQTPQLPLQNQYQTTQYDAQPQRPLPPMAVQTQEPNIQNQLPTIPYNAQPQRQLPPMAAHTQQPSQNQLPTIPYDDQSQRQLPTMAPQQSQQLAKQKPTPTGQKQPKTVKKTSASAYEAQPQKQLQTMSMQKQTQQLLSQKKSSKSSSETHTQSQVTSIASQQQQPRTQKPPITQKPTEYLKTSQQTQQSSQTTMTATTAISQDNVNNKKSLASMRKSVSVDHPNVREQMVINPQNSNISQEMLTKLDQQRERINNDIRRKSLGNALDYQLEKQARYETQQQTDIYKSSAPSNTPDIVKSSLPKDENQPILKKFGPPQRHHYMPNSYQSPGTNVITSSASTSQSTTIHSKNTEVSSNKTIVRTSQQHQHISGNTRPAVVETPATPQPDDDYIPRNIVFNNIHAFTSMSRRQDEDTSFSTNNQEQSPIRPNKLSKSDSWNQIIQLQNQHIPPPSPKFNQSPTNELRRTKSGHTLALPKMYEAAMAKSDINEKKKTVAAYFSGQKSPIQQELVVEQHSTKKTVINRTKTSEKVSAASRKSLGSNLPIAPGGLTRSATMPHIANLNLLDESNVEDAFEQLIMDQKQQKSSSSTTEKTETKEKDGAVVTTTTKVTTRTVSGSAPKPVSPFAKFKQLDGQNSQQSAKSPTTPTTPGGAATASPSSPSSGNQPIFRFTDPALNARAATVKDQLLQWCQMKTQEYENIEITNFSTSWNNGLAFCALLHHFLPDAFDYSQLTPKNRRKNFELAFTVADEKAGIAPLLDVEDMVVMQRPDWKCVFIYVQSIYRRFRNCQ